MPPKLVVCTPCFSRVQINFAAICCNWGLSCPEKRCFLFNVFQGKTVGTKQFQKCLSFLDQSPDVKDIIPRALNILMGARQTLYENLN